MKIINDDNGVFNDCPEFYLSDNRRNRHFNPITKEILEGKLKVLLPQALIKDKSILDLGSCMGASGQWALYYGASSYTGVELQESYAIQSRKLLKHWKSKAHIFNQDIRSFLKSEKKNTYDIILMSGVIYLFVDPKKIIDEMCRVSKDIVVIETNYPLSIRNGKLSPQASITEYTYNQEVNLSMGTDSLLGISATSSLSALDLMFGLNGFGKNEAKLHFPKNRNMLNYSDENITESEIPLRFAVCYHKKITRKLATLEGNMPERKGFRRSWKDSPLCKKTTHEREKIAREFNCETGSWKFDDKIARSFSKIADREIPDYRRVIDKTVEVVKKCSFKNPKIIDIGSATGITLECFYKKGYRNLFGVDNSREMIEQSFNKATLIHSHLFPTEYGPFDVIVANWVLHFIERREIYLSEIKKSLSQDGVFILTEKIASSSLAYSLYDDFKRNNGMTEKEIEAKREQLKGVLTPYSLAWYQDVFRRVGFDSVDIINANSVFVTFLLKNDYQ